MKPKTVVPLTNGDAKKAVARFGRSPRVPGVPLLPVGPPEDVWLAARRAGPDGYRVGASELAAVLGISPYASPFSLWWSKQDGWDAEPASRRQRYGHAVEDGIAGLFGEDHPELLVCRPGAGLWGHPVERWLVATPDFLAVAADAPLCSHGGDCLVHRDAAGLHNLDDQGGVHVEPVECKSDDGGKGWGKPGTDQVPPHHRVQLLVQCEILGAPRGWLVRKEHAYVIEYDAAARAEMKAWLAEGRSFVVSLETGISPDIDGHEATTDTLTQLHPAVEEGAEEPIPAALAVEFGAALDALDAAKNRAEEAKNRLRDRMGAAQFAVDTDGRRVAQRLIYKRRGYEVPAGMVDQLRRTK
ncbi:YqaJ viral recombinase family protein [Micromonospora aurantiaca]|uniref:YqaJ viral recombinase family protein n=1 Tax=Micromonospora aurantiaca (nom. illeg.) TaxID=47850 RepID=UPI0013C30F61|nr:YqaJ viral recombinase family protein [Micromonospora aurantiaca]